jgi:hypothetical protein
MKWELGIPVLERGPRCMVSTMCTDDILAIRINPRNILAPLNKYITLKHVSIHTSNECLGAKWKGRELQNVTTS